MLRVCYVHMYICTMCMLWTGDMCAHCVCTCHWTAWVPVHVPVPVWVGGSVARYQSSCSCSSITEPGSTRRPGTRQSRPLDLCLPPRSLLWSIRLSIDLLSFFRQQHKTRALAWVQASHEVPNPNRIGTTCLGHSARHVRTGVGPRARKGDARKVSCILFLCDSWWNIIYFLLDICFSEENKIFPRDPNRSRDQDTDRDRGPVRNNRQGCGPGSGSATCCEQGTHIRMWMTTSLCSDSNIRKNRAPDLGAKAPRSGACDSN